VRHRWHRSLAAWVVLTIVLGACTTSNDVQPDTNAPPSTTQPDTSAPPSTTGPVIRVTPKTIEYVDVLRGASAVFDEHTFVDAMDDVMLVEFGEIACTQLDGGSTFERAAAALIGAIQGRFDDLYDADVFLARELIGAAVVSFCAKHEGPQLDEFLDMEKGSIEGLDDRERAFIITMGLEELTHASPGDPMWALRVNILAKGYLLASPDMTPATESVIVGGVTESFGEEFATSLLSASQILDGESAAGVVVGCFTDFSPPQATDQETIDAQIMELDLCILAHVNEARG